MKIDGKAIADAILGDLEEKVLQLKTQGVVPTLAVILVGDNTESLAYIRQKQKITEKIGGRFIFERLPVVTSPKELAARIEMYNRDPSVHALIVQRPLPKPMGEYHVALSKDIDGFEPGSPYDVPIVAAIFTILESIKVDFHNKNIVILGRGETAGTPIAAAFTKRDCATSVVHSETPNPKEIMKMADILVSCVGKQRVVTADAVKKGAIVLSVGLWHDQDGAIHGDYEEEDVKDVAAYYTPTPGGVGPVNVACLMQNLVKACTIK